jgi:hypothetical protein
MTKRLGGSLLGFGVKSACEFCMSYECAARRGARERAISLHSQQGQSNEDKSEDHINHRVSMPDELYAFTRMARAPASS